MINHMYINSQVQINHSSYPDSVHFLKTSVRIGLGFLLIYFENLQTSFRYPHILQTYELKQDIGFGLK